MSTKEIFLDVAAKLPPDATIVDAKALLSQDGLKNLGKGVAR